jgi:hypothetical protein
MRLLLTLLIDVGPSITVTILLTYVTRTSALSSKYDIFDSEVISELFVILVEI